MKKILAFVLTATLLCAMFILPAAADDDKNFEAEIPYVETAPVVDGVVNVSEYGSVFAMHSYSEDKSQFSDTDDFDAYDNWDVEFYSAYDAENLYMAWVVKSDVHASLPMTDASGDGIFDELDYPYMWQYSCVQFILTPGNPTSGENYTGNYLEVGFGLDGDGGIIRAIWSYPAGVEEDDISINDWDAVIVRDDVNNTTTYEIAIPASMSGLATWGSKAQFGLSYAAAAQENFNDKPGMLEWQDACLGNGGKKQPNNCAVMTLAESDVENVQQETGLQDGTIPEDADGVLQIAIDRIGGYVLGEDSFLVIEDPVNKVNDYNNFECTNLVLLPIEGTDGEYEVVDLKIGDGENYVIWDADLEQEGLLVLSVNSEGGIGADRLAAVQTIGEGSIVKLFGIDLENGERTYKNSMMYVLELVEPVEDEESSEAPSEEPTSEEPSEEESKESSKESSKETSEETSSKASVATSSVASDNDGGSNTGLIIGIIAAVVVVVAVVVVIVMKKKKA